MSRFVLVSITVILTLAFEFSNGWHDAANSIATVVSTRVLTPFRAVHAMESPDKALQHVIEINRLENESDRICRTLIAQLFEEEKDPVQIIKWKEIFEVIETAVDKCEDVSNVIESVILKNA